MEKKNNQLTIKAEELPKVLKILYNNGRLKEYILRITKDKQGVFLNKKEY